MTDRRAGFVYTPAMTDRSDSAALFSAEARRAFYEGHRSLALFMILIVFVAPFAGLYVAGLLGVVLGVLISGAAYVLTPCLWKWNGD
jgi:thiamine transporter ThiT